MPVCIKCKTASDNLVSVELRVRGNSEETSDNFWICPQCKAGDVALKTVLDSFGEIHAKNLEENKKSEQILLTEG